MERAPDEPAARRAAESWFAARGWQPFDFQRRVWAAMAEGRSGLLHASTGAGKTYAVWLGALARRREGPGLQVLWITPMRALAADTTRALQAPLAELAPGFTVAQRSGDTPAAERARQQRRWPAALVTTPESLSLLLTRERARDELGGVHTVIVDEWHELVGNKRGVQVQLALARLRRWNPALGVWGLSATLGAVEHAMAALCGPGGELVRGRIDKTILIDPLAPAQPGRFSWAGHLGAQMLQPVVDEIDAASTTLVFTNTRSQSERWYQMLLQSRPDWAGLIALHHGSLDRAARDWVEQGLKDGRLKAVVATSSLDLGVDFLPVERVLQIGSAKGVARLLQRAGRSGHAPGRPSRITLVPTNTLELVEAAAARRAALAGEVEPRHSPDAPLDVLVQHLVTVALGGGFDADPHSSGGFDADPDDTGGRHGAEAMFDEVRSAPAYAALSREAFDWALAFVARGGTSLAAYPEYHRVRVVDGRWRVADRGIAQRHRMQVGTIVGDATMAVAWVGGGTLGQVEESFVARLRKGDCFVFGGRVLEYVRSQDMTAFVRRATRADGVVPVWQGGRMPLSSELARSVLRCLADASDGRFDEPELQLARPMLDAQQRLSRLPRPGRLLAETLRSREGHHLFLYPFAGRNVHLGLAQLIAWRLARAAPGTFSLSVNDYGLEIVAANAPDLAPLEDGSLFAPDALLDDLLASLDAGALAQRRFREIARVAGLVFSGYPGAPKSMRQLQASSSLLHEVFRKYDPGNRLLVQARDEALQHELDLARLREALQAMASATLDRVALPAPSPLALPLMVDRLRERLSNEKLNERVARMVAEAEAALDAPARPRPRRRRALA